VGPPSSLTAHWGIGGAIAIVVGHWRLCWIIVEGPLGHWWGHRRRWALAALLGGALGVVEHAVIIRGSFGCWWGRHRCCWALVALLGVALGIVGAAVVVGDLEAVAVLVAHWQSLLRVARWWGRDPRGHCGWMDVVGPLWAGHSWVDP
jgi:hypothetical protein